LLTKAEKERRVVELYEEGKTYREITREVRISPGDISDIIKRHTGELQGTVKPQNALQKPETIDTRAFKLFEEGKTPVKVAIELDLRSDEVTKLYTEYLKLKGLEELSLLYEERKDDLHEFHRAYKLAVDEGVAPQQLIVAANYLQDIASLESRCEVLKREVEGLENKSGEIYNSIVTANQDLNSYNVSINVHRQENTRLHNHKQQLQSVIAGLEQSEGYQQVQRIAEGIVMSILADNRMILETAIRTVLQALRTDIDLRLLVEPLQRYAAYYQRTGNQFCHAKMLELSIILYNDLLAKCVNDTMSSMDNTYDQHPLTTASPGMDFST
jgi:chromosome segregation ATPase